MDFYCLSVPILNIPSTERCLTSCYEYLNGYECLSERQEGLESKRGAILAPYTLTLPLARDAYRVSEGFATHTQKGNIQGVVKDKKVCGLKSDGNNKKLNP